MEREREEGRGGKEGNGEERGGVGKGREGGPETGQASANFHENFKSVLRIQISKLNVFFLLIAF